MASTLVFPTITGVDLVTHAQLIPPQSVFEASPVQTPLFDANDDSEVTDEDHSITVDVLANDSQLGPGQTRVESVTVPPHGTALINADSTITYTPNQDFFGSDSFEYTATYSINGVGLESDTATVFFTINPVNDPPVANDDSAVTDEDNVIKIDVVANDFDVDGDPLRVVSTTQPSNGIVRPFSDGMIGYSPDNNFFGTDSFTYTISDGNGGTDTATVTITINAVNDPPITADDTARTPINQSVTIDVLSNDSDADGDLFSVTSTSTPANGTATINQDNTVTYTPNQDFTGSDSFTYTISDGNGGSDTATVSVTVDRILAKLPSVSPQGIDVNPVTNTVYVAQWLTTTTADSVLIIDGFTDEFITTLDGGFKLRDVSVNDATNMFYVTSASGGVSGVMVFNGTTNTREDSISGGGFGITRADVNLVTNTIYLSHSGGNGTVIDGNTNSVTTIIEMTGQMDVAVNHNTNKVYFAMGNGMVTVVDGTTNTITEMIPTFAGSLFTVGVNTITNTIYVADGGDFSGPTEVTVIDGSNNSVTAKVLVGNSPRGIAVNEKTNTIYVTNRDDDTVSVINGNTNQVVATWNVGDGPESIAVNPETNKVYVGNVQEKTIAILKGLE